MTDTLKATERLLGTKWYRAYKTVVEIVASISFLVGFVRRLVQLSAGALGITDVPEMVRVGVTYCLATVGIVVFPIMLWDAVCKDFSGTTEGKVRQKYRLYLGLPMILFFAFAIWKWRPLLFLAIMSGSMVAIILIVVGIGKMIKPSEEERSGIGEQKSHG